MRYGIERKKDTWKRLCKRALKLRTNVLKHKKKANSTVDMIRRTLVTRDKDTILRLYISLVRSQLEYCIQVWMSIPELNMEELEKV